MGRIFEVRKSSMFARWDKMAKNFTRIGKEIVIAVKNGGPEPDNNPALRRCYINAKSCGMPKDRVEAAIKRAMGKDTSNYEEITYEGYAPHGVALLVETATDNPTRTVANVIMHFTKSGGSLGTSGSVAFTFNRLGEFKVKNTKNISYVPIVLFILSYSLIIFVSIQKKYYIHLFIYLLSCFALFFLIYLKVKDDMKVDNKIDNKEDNKADNKNYKKKE